MARVIYLNSEGNGIELLNHKIKIVDADIHNYNWEYVGISKDMGIEVTKFKKEPLLFDMTIFVDENIHSQLNELLELTETDILNKKAGKLYFNEYYLECFMISSSTKPSEDFGAERSWKVFAPYPFWIKESTYDFYKDSNNASAGGLDYKLNYNYDYTESTKGVEVLQRNHFAKSHFKLEIFGAVVNPRIAIGKNIYELEYTISDGEVIEIDSRQEKVIKRAVNGDEKNIFYTRSRTHNIFELIEPKTQKVNWNGNFGFALTVFEERSEPRW